MKYLPQAEKNCGIDLQNEDFVMGKGPPQADFFSILNLQNDGFVLENGPPQAENFAILDLQNEDFLLENGPPQARKKFETFPWKLEEINIFSWLFLENANFPQSFLISSANFLQTLISSKR